MGVLSNLQPKEVLEFFEQLTQIPHGTFHTDKISDFLLNFAKERNLKCRQDEANNVIVWKDGTPGYENSDPVIIQGHMDMVCEKVDGSDFDFETDPLKLIVDGDKITADGTTLGADDGIAVAMGMALLDDDSLKHPPLEVIFTSDEETGLVGANAIDMSDIKGRKLINIDSEEEGVFTVGCAGGICTHPSIPVKRAEAKGTLLKVTIDGLKGGHSGMEIDKERGNANNLMARVLWNLAKEMDVNIVSFAGGLKHNAICKRSDLSVIVADADVEKAEKIIKEMDTDIHNEYRNADTDPHVRYSNEGAAEESAVIPSDSRRIAIFLLNVPAGLQHMSLDLPGLVETSLNLGALELKEDSVEMTFAIRSAVKSRQDELVDKFESLAELAGATVTFDDGYPAWAIKEDSELRDRAIEVFEAQYGKKPEIFATHGGLECGLFAGKIGPELDCLSIGPDMAHVHTPDEFVSAESVDRTWKFLVKLLEELK